jgi:FKBP-type peptidyl-prolyl cis-trans isomerase (trigger factor)
MLVVERVAEMHGLRATQDEVDARVEEIAQRNDRPVGEVWTQLQRSGRLHSLEDEITEGKVFEYLKSQSTIRGA